MTSEQKAKLRAAADQLLTTGVSVKDVASVLSERQNVHLHVAETAKPHPLQKVTFTDSEWGDLFTHLLDGGGVLDIGAMLGDAPSLLDQFHTAAVAADRVAAMHLLPAIVKGLLKQRGARRQLSGGGVSSGPVGAGAHAPGFVPAPVKGLTEGTK